MLVLMWSSVRRSLVVVEGHDDYRSALLFHLLLAVFYCFLWVFLYMDVFNNMTLVELGRRYWDNETRLVAGLMTANLVSAQPPTCHGEMTPFAAKPSCAATKPMITENCFLFGGGKYLQTVFEM